MAHINDVTTVIDGLTVREVNGTTYVLATDIAVGLEYTRPIDIHKLAKRLKRDGKMNDSDMYATVETTVDERGVAHPCAQLWVTETGGLILAISSRTKKANVICRAVVAACIAHRHTRLGTSLAAPDTHLADAIASVRGDVSALRGELAKSHDAVMLATTDTRDTLARSHAVMMAAVSDTHAAVMTAVSNAHVAVMTAQGAIHDEQMKALRTIWKADQAAHVEVLKALHAYGSLAGRVDWYERNAPVDGVISAKQHLEISRLARDIAEAEAKAGLWKGSIPAARRDVYRELGEVVRWGSTEQKWRMLPAQRIGDARTCLARRYKTAIAMVRAAAATAKDSRQQDLFEWLARIDASTRKETKH